MSSLPVMATFSNIPVIDISALLKRCKDPQELSMENDISDQVIQEIKLACKDVGFFYVKGHNIPDSLVKAAKEVSQQFFYLSNEEKLKIKMTPKTGYRGYQRIRENITKGKPDFQEAIDYYRELDFNKYGEEGKVLKGSNQWPENPPNFNGVMGEYISLMTDLAKNIMRGIALSLGGSPLEFERHVADDPFWVMRVIGYPGIPENDIGCGVHTDYGLLTLINQDDDVSALQVMNKSGEWMWALPVPGTFVCNIGDMLEICTNGIYKATPHKVINNSTKYRVSVAYFYEPTFDAVVKPLKICKEKTDFIEKFEKGALYKDHLAKKILNNFV